MKKQPGYSDLILEKYLLKELSPDMMQRIEKDASSNVQIKQRIDALSASNEDILQQYSADRVTAQIRHKRDQLSGSKMSVLNWQPAIAVAASMVLVVSLLVFNGNNQSITPVYDQQGIDGVRLKGLQPHLKLYRLIEGSVEALDVKATAREGDIIQLAYVAAGQPYGMVFSVDGNRVVSLHYPAGENMSPVLSNEGETMLNFSYQLDSAPSFERFYLVTSYSAFSVAAILRQAEQAFANQEMPGDEFLAGEGFKQYTFELKKAE